MFCLPSLPYFLCQKKQVMEPTLAGRVNASGDETKEPDEGVELQDLDMSEPSTTPSDDMETTVSGDGEQLEVLKANLLPHGTIKAQKVSFVMSERTFYVIRQAID